MDQTAIRALLKFGTHDHIKQLQAGTLYFNTIQYFAGCDSSNGRGDKFETIYRQEENQAVTLNLAKEFHNTNVTAYRKPNYGGYISHFENADFYANLYCLFGIYTANPFNEEQIVIPERMRAFGDYFLLITDPREFLRRVIENIADRVSNFHYGNVNYIDTVNLNGWKNYFEKPKSYSYQSEFRLAYQNTSEKPEIFNIGSFNDISVILKSTECVKISFIKSEFPRSS
jgi:hypothetical protein